jgi:glutamine phosphoribosylpyrophosphate amidotransferase
MCAVIGAFLRSPSFDDLDRIKIIFIESKIRGMHSTGLSYIKGNTIHTIKESVPADKFKFLDELHNCINEDGNLYLIGHCRYSTSDLLYNQPISDGKLSVVHNGVITQELYDNWKSLYGYECNSKNDTELLLHTISDEKDIFEVWEDSSLSVCELKTNKTLRFYRNGKRPLYYSFIENGLLVSSSSDILKRSGLIDINEIEPFTYKTYYDFCLTDQEANTKELDLQNE